MTQADMTLFEIFELIDQYIEKCLPDHPDKDDIAQDLKLEAFTDKYYLNKNYSAEYIFDAYIHPQIKRVVDSYNDFYQN